ncbi:MAG: IS66 family transposase zinc-finger binding domain-containing protein [Deltaproteobacteria bacterium]|nr:IS66 family transposase zinc-finger binding domain-containing protein [Candidatus Anaeroferrophillacea bacterium]
MTRIGADVSEQLQVEPPKFTVLRNIRPKYACRSGEGIESDRTVRIAPAQAAGHPQKLRHAVPAGLGNLGTLLIF